MEKKALPLLCVCQFVLFCQNFVSPLLRDVLYKKIILKMPALNFIASLSLVLQRLFVQSMISLVIAKLRKDTPALLAEPALLSHTIDELLSFTTDLGSLSPTTATQRTSLLKVLEEDGLLNAWLSVEEACECCLYFLLPISKSLTS